MMLYKEKNEKFEGIWYISYFRENNCYLTGKYYYADGSVYDGSFDIDGNKSGKGLYVCETYEYDGEW